jgi:TRAP-type C4-dicarboxylate transport system substrate-binding protein
MYWIVGKRESHGTFKIIPVLFNLCRAWGLLKSTAMKNISSHSVHARMLLFRMVFGLFGLAVLLSSLFSPAMAQLLPQTELKVVGGLSSRPGYTEIEQPFWNQTIAERSEGAVTAQIKGFDELGLKGQELLRLMRQGVIEFGTVPLSYYAREVSLFEAIDIAGLVPNQMIAKETSNAFFPVLKHYLATSHQVKLLGVAPYGAQFFYCNVEIRSLADLKGQTIRTITRTQAELVEALGAKNASLPFAEVLKALESKSISCAIGGAYTGYTAKWYQASTHLYAMPVGWNQEVHAVNQKVWDSLNEPVQKFLESNIEMLIQHLWAFSEKLTQRGIDCNTGSKGCLSMPRGQMTLVTPSNADLATIKRISTQKVLPKWSERCADACFTDFNQTIGKLLKSK